MNIQRVADHIYLSGAFITAITNRLSKRGLIHKTIDPADRRRTRLQVSMKGGSLLTKLAPIQRQVNDVAFGCLNRSEFLQLLDIVERLTGSSERTV